MSQGGEGEKMCVLERQASLPWLAYEQIFLGCAADECIGETCFKDKIHKT